MTASTEGTDIEIGPEPEHSLDVVDGGFGVVRQHLVPVGIVSLEQRAEEILVDILVFNPHLGGIA